VRTVAVILFDGVELMDFAGPAEVFIISDEGKSYRVITVADTLQPVKLMGGIRIMPDYTFSSVPKSDIIVVPGGDLSQFSQTGREWLKQASNDIEIILSVCYGAFVLADIGLLEGIEATTHHWGLLDLQKVSPNCKVITGQRFVHSGKVVTSAGVTSGIDAALHVIELQLGKAAAKWTAEEWMEYNCEKPVEK